MNFEQRQVLLATRIYLVSEAMMFVALIVGYIYLRRASHTWGATGGELEWKTAGVFTLMLVLSSFTLNWCVKSYEKKRTANFAFWAVSTLALGGAFLANQLREYSNLYQKAIRLESSTFGSAFYTLTGVHTLHVIVGLGMLCVILWLMHKKKVASPSSGARAVEYYWHFVDAVWLVVYTTVYLGGVYF